MDLRQLSGGAVFGVGRTEFTLGLSYAYGNEQVPQFIDFKPGQILNPDGKATLKVNRLKFIFGFSLGF
jgi:hypothetical protein